MKSSLHGKLLAAALSATAASANAQTLGSAANYDILALNGGVVEFTSSNKLFGRVGFSNGTNVKVGKNSQTFQGTVFKHTGATIDQPASLMPSGGIQSSPAVDSALNQANVDVGNYVNYLNGLSANQTYGKVQTSFSYSALASLTVLDFTELDLENETFTLNGRANGMDRIIIRVSDNFEFKEADLILNNLSVENVIWYYTGQDQFDLHKSDPANFMKFAGTIVAPDPAAQIRLGEVSFTGRAIGVDLKMGSGFAFQGVPEPSSSLLVIASAGLLLVRRRRN